VTVGARLVCRMEGRESLISLLNSAHGLEQERVAAIADILLRSGFRNAQQLVGISSEDLRADVPGLAAGERNCIVQVASTRGTHPFWSPPLLTF